MVLAIKAKKMSRNKDPTDLALHTIRPATTHSTRFQGTGCTRGPPMAPTHHLSVEAQPSEGLC